MHAWQVSDSISNKQKYTQNMKRTMRSFALINCALVVLWTAGCAQQQHRSQQPAAATTAEKAKPAPAPVNTSCNDATWGLIKMTKTMPAEVPMGGEFMAVLHLTAQGCSANVVVRDTLPGNATYVRSEPAGTVDGKQLTWVLGDLDSGASRDLKVWLKADKEGTIVNCATVSADPRTCAATHVVRPAIQLVKTAPAEVTICDPIPITLTVKNAGSSTLTAVKVQDTLPQGLTSGGQQSLSFDAGDLAPGASKEFKFTAAASKPGKFVNVAKATSAQNVTDDAETTTVVHEPVLAISCKAPEQRYMGRPFDVCYTVVNKGDSASAATVVEVAVPAGATFRSATAGGTVSGGKVVWNVGSLAPNAPQDLCATFVSAGAGTFRFEGSAKGACAKLVATSCQTTVIGVSALLLEKSDDPDPIAVGETTTYIVRVTNQGTADDTNVKMTVEFPAEITPVSASNGGTISGKKVTFPAYPRLAPKANFTYTIVAKGEKVGDARVTFIRTSDGIPAPTSAEESTRVY
jgi:uncharacterized repeat protein (TIGR01451 family)